MARPDDGASAGDASRRDVHHQVSDSRRRSASSGALFVSWAGDEHLRRGRPVTAADEHFHCPGGGPSCLGAGLDEAGARHRRWPAWPVLEVLGGHGPAGVRRTWGRADLGALERLTIQPAAAPERLLTRATRNGRLEHGRYWKPHCQCRREAVGPKKKARWVLGRHPAWRRRRARRHRLRMWAKTATRR